MRICFIEDTPLNGGTQFWVEEAIRYCLALGIEVTLLAPEKSWIVGRISKTQAQISTYDWGDVTRQSTYDKRIWTKALENCQIALCTVHPPRAAFHCVTFAAKCIHESKLQTYLSPKTGTIVPEYKREYYRPSANINSSVIAISKFTQRYLVEKYSIPMEEVNLIYQGVDLHRFRSSQEIQDEAGKRILLPAKAAPVLACIGSFEDRKGQTHLLEAISQLAKSTLPDIQLALVGDGPDEEKLRSLVYALDLEEHVVFFPFTQHPEFVFESVDLTVLPSIEREGLPNVILESMAMGTPVIASHLGGIPEIIVNGENGFLVAPGDIGQLAEAILELWRRPGLRRKMSRKALQMVQTHFDREKQFAQFLNFFNMVTSSQ